MKDNILIVEDDKFFADTMKKNLEGEAYKIDIVGDFQSALEKVKEGKINLVVMDPDIKELKGCNLCRAIREISLVPIIITSEKDDDSSKVLAFEYGVDDYMTKPFNMLELKARIEAIFKRIEYSSLEAKKHILNMEDVKINTLKRKISLKGKEINLTGKEFDLFYILSTSPGKVFTREELLKSVWGYAYFGDLRTVDVHIRRIREKIEEIHKDNKYIMTKWGVGYYFNNDH